MEPLLTPFIGGEPVTLNVAGRAVSGDAAAFQRQGGAAAACAREFILLSDAAVSI